MKTKQKDLITIGLFGTCGNSQWRVPFIEYFERERIEYFNPVVPDWTPVNAVIEAEHLIKDEIILFPVTDETFGFGSLAEVGFSITQAIKSNKEGFVVIYVAPKVSDVLTTADPKSAKESNKARALCIEHMLKQKENFPNVFVVDSMKKMLEVTIHLYNAMLAIKKAREKSI